MRVECACQPLAKSLVNVGTPQRRPEEQDPAPDARIGIRRWNVGHAQPCAVALRIAPAGAVDAGEDGGVAEGVEPVGSSRAGEVAESVGREDGVGARAGVVDLLGEDKYDGCA